MTDSILQLNWNSICLSLICAVVSVVKRTVQNPTVAAQMTSVVLIVLVAKSKPTDSNYIRLSENAKPEKFASIGKQVMNGEIVPSHYTLDGNLGYYYYIKVSD